MNPVRYFRLRRSGRIVYPTRGGWVRWKLDLLLLRLRVRR